MRVGGELDCGCGSGGGKAEGGEGGCEARVARTAVMEVM